MMQKNNIRKIANAGFTTRRIRNNPSPARFTQNPYDSHNRLSVKRWPYRSPHSFDVRRLAIDSRNIPLDLSLPCRHSRSVSHRLRCESPHSNWRKRCPTCTSGPWSCCGFKPCSCLPKLTEVRARKRFRQDLITGKSLLQLRLRCRVLPVFVVFRLVL